jgi:hypothetical protein
LIGGGIVAGQLLCYLLALVAAEARETWTGLRNQGSQLLSTGIGIGRRALHVIGCMLH